MKFFFAEIGVGGNAVPDFPYFVCSIPEVPLYVAVIERFDEVKKSNMADCLENAKLRDFTRWILIGFNKYVDTCASNKNETTAADHVAQCHGCKDPVRIKSLFLGILFHAMKEKYAVNLDSLQEQFFMVHFNDYVEDVTRDFNVLFAEDVCNHEMQRFQLARGLVEDMEWDDYCEKVKTQDDAFVREMTAAGHITRSCAAVKEKKKDDE